MHLLKPLSALVLLAVSCAGPATYSVAQEQMTPEEIEAALQKPQGGLTAKDIEAALTPKKPLTRSIGASPKKKELDGILSRSIGVVERKKIVEITKAEDYPSLDFSITFGFDSADIEAASYPTLDTLAAALKSDKLGNAKFLVNGHTDSKGSDDYNLALSQRRADSVVQYLMAQHSIDPARLKAIGFGEGNLKDVSDGESGVNRRVEIVNLP
jgi:outer membrane protein OmpA-like peptidoglycan-associated protein